MSVFWCGFLGYWIAITTTYFLGAAIDPHAGYNVVIPVNLGALFIGVTLGAVLGHIVSVRRVPTA